MISAIVPTLGSRELLERYLPSVQASLEACGEPWEIVVVDDGGGLESAPACARLLTLSENVGYGPAVNAGVEAARGELLLVINDDVELEADMVAGLRPHLARPNVFAAVPAIRSPLAETGDEGGKRGVWRAGQLEIVEELATDVQPVLYPVGCCFLCSRAGFIGLGGFDDIYAPAYWEDVDLGYRAWRRGLSVLQDPRVSCRHQGSATIEQFEMARRQRWFFRNRVLFHLLNVRDPDLRAQMLGSLLAHALLDPEAPQREGLLEAFERFGERQKAPSATGLGDREILERVRPS